MTAEDEARRWAEKSPPELRKLTYETVLLSRRLQDLCGAQPVNVAMSAVLGLMTFMVSRASEHKEDPINQNFLRTLYRILETDGRDAGGVTVKE